MVTPSSTSFHVLSKQARYTARQYKESRSHDENQKINRRSLILGSVDDILDGTTYHGSTDTMKNNNDSLGFSNNSFHNEEATTQQVKDSKSKRRFQRRGSCTIYNLSLETSHNSSRRGQNQKQLSNTATKQPPTIDERPIPLKKNSSHHGQHAFDKQRPTKLIDSNDEDTSVASVAGSFCCDDDDDDDSSDDAGDEMDNDEQSQVTMGDVSFNKKPPMIQRNYSLPTSTMGCRLSSLLPLRSSTVTRGQEGTRKKRAAGIPLSTVFSSSFASSRNCEKYIELASPIQPVASEFSFGDDVQSPGSKDGSPPSRGYAPPTKMLKSPSKKARASRRQESRRMSMVDIPTNLQLPLLDVDDAPPLTVMGSGGLIP